MKIPLEKFFKQKMELEQKNGYCCGFFCKNGEEKVERGVQMNQNKTSYILRRRMFKLFRDDKQQKKIKVAGLLLSLVSIITTIHKVEGADAPRNYLMVIFKPSPVVKLRARQGNSSYPPIRSQQDYPLEFPSQNKGEWCSSSITKTPQNLKKMEYTKKINSFNNLNSPSWKGLPHSNSFDNISNENKDPNNIVFGVTASKSLCDICSEKEWSSAKVSDDENSRNRSKGSGITITTSSNTPSNTPLNTAVPTRPGTPTPNLNNSLPQRVVRRHKPKVVVISTQQESSEPISPKVPNILRLVWPVLPKQTILQNMGTNDLMNIINVLNAGNTSLCFDNDEVLMTTLPEFCHCPKAWNLIRQRFFPSMSMREFVGRMFAVVPRAVISQMLWLYLNNDDFFNAFSDLLVVTQVPLNYSEERNAQYMALQYWYFVDQGYNLQTFDTMNGKYGHPGQVGNVVYCDSCSKGDILTYLERHTSLNNIRQSGLIVMVDDKLQNLEDMKEAAWALGKKFIGIHYTAAQKFKEEAPQYPTSLAVSAAQVVYCLRTGYWLTPMLLLRRFDGKLIFQDISELLSVR